MKTWEIGVFCQRLIELGVKFANGCMCLAFVEFSVMYESCFVGFFCRASTEGQKNNLNLDQFPISRCHIPMNGLPLTAKKLTLKMDRIPHA